MTKNDAMKRVCAAIEKYMTNGMENEFLNSGYSEKDAARMAAAFDKLMAELRRRSK